MWVLGYHGSTALQNVLANNNSTATLCAGRSWQCEARYHEGRCKHDRLKVCSACRQVNGNKLPALSCVKGDPDPANFLVSWSDHMHAYQWFWKAAGIEKRTVLITKWVPINSRMGSVSDKNATAMASSSDFGINKLFVANDIPLAQLERNVPFELAQKGIEWLRWGVVMQHRPWCMWRLSSHAREERVESLQAWAEEELRLIEKFVLVHKKLIEMGVPVLMQSYSELLWWPAAYVQRFKIFAPCLPPPDPWTSPTVGVHIFESNALKIHGSVAAYGASHGAGECCKYAEPASGKGRCTEPPDVLYQGLDGRGRQRAAELERYIAQSMGRQYS